MRALATRKCRYRGIRPTRYSAVLPPGLHLTLVLYLLSFGSSCRVYYMPSIATKQQTQRWCGYAHF